MVTDTDILNALRTVVDPELGINIVDLGLVYGVEIADGRLRIEMTMTSPACPLQDFLKAQILEALAQWHDAFAEIDVDIVTDPPWSAERMSDTARRQLGEL